MVHKEHLSHARGPFWNPIYTRFSVGDTRRLSGLSQSQLQFLSAGDSQAAPVDDIDDPSPRRRYYNFWSLARIHFYSSIGGTLYLTSELKEFLNDLENEIEEYFESKKLAYFSHSLLAEVATSLEKMEHPERKTIHRAVDSKNITSVQIRRRYWASVCRVAFDVSSILDQELLEELS